MHCFSIDMILTEAILATAHSKINVYYQVWRSRRRARELGINLDEMRMARELRISHPRPEPLLQPTEAPISPEKVSNPYI